MSKTTSQRQKRFREQIAKGEKKRLQVVISRDEADKLDDICTEEGVNKTDFIRNAIQSWPEKNEEPNA